MTNKPSKWSQLTAGGKILSVISDLLLTFAFIILLYILYQLYWTALPSFYAQEEAAASVVWDTPDDSNKAAEPITDYLPCESINDSAWRKLWPDSEGSGSWGNMYSANWSEPQDDNTMIGRIYIPTFGGDFSRNLVQGTTRITLDKQGFGHYRNMAMPGCIGNFAAAAHRDGYGAPLGDVESIKTGDAIIIRTKEFWYVYTATDHEVVSANNTSVLLPVPNEPDLKPTRRLITLTTCHPRWSMRQRYIQYGEFKYWAKVKSGVPQELLDVNANVKINAK